MMRNNVIRRSSLLASAVLTATLLLLLPRVTLAQNVTRHAKVGPFAITLKVLPAEAFRGPHATMVRAGGRQPYYLSHRPRPNRHMVVFIKQHGRPVIAATRVQLRYRQLSPRRRPWVRVPVVRMYVAGKGRQTTHYGNNVRLAPGRYAVQVSVDRTYPAVFHFWVKK